MGNSMVLKTGGGIDPDVLTASAGDVLKGKTAGVNGSDEPATGTLELTGNSGAGDVLTGKTFYTTNPKTKQTGTMANRGTVNQALNAGGSYTIPAGYHNGSGRVTANSLSSQTSGTATAAYIRSGYTAWVNGNKLTGSMTVSSILSFSVAAYSTNQMTATWKNPAKGPYSGVIIRYKTGSYPTSVTDGTQGYKGTGNNSAANGVSTVTIGGLSQGTTYYFRVWAYVTTSVGEIYSGYLSATGVTTTRGIQTFTSSETFSVPPGVRTIDIFCVGGGGAGSCGVSEDDYSWGYTNGYGGGSGYTKTLKGYSVSPGQSFAVTVGAGSDIPSVSKTNYGGTSTFGSVISAAGGMSGLTAKSGSGSGNGGCGGGHPGGSNGANGANTSMGKGQGTTTRAFGEASNTLYGGGGSDGERNTWGPIAGGAPGGGAGAHYNVQSHKSHAVAGKDSTGGGGGGGVGLTQSTMGAARGGSGIVLVRWGY